jgi:hypothetical protein
MEGSMPTGDMGAGGDIGMGGEPAAGGPPMENRYRGKKVINENLDRMFDKYLSKLNEHTLSPKETKYKRVESYSGNSFLINEEFDKMIDALGKFVENDDEE